jgi:hypothetical protein
MHKVLVKSKATGLTVLTFFSTNFYSCNDFWNSANEHYHPNDYEMVWEMEDMMSKRRADDVTFKMAA